MFEECIDWIVSLQNSSVETLTLIVTVFKDSTFKKIIKMKWGPKSIP